MGLRLRLKAGLVIYIAKFDKCPGNYGYILIVNCVDVLGIFDIFSSADIVNIMNIVDILNNLNNSQVCGSYCPGLPLPTE